MKRLFFTLLLGASVMSATSQVRMPAPSPTQTVKQDFGISSIELTYSRPSLKGRKVIGDVDKYGKLWRTGANAATKLRFLDPVMIGGKMIDTGSYALYTIPNKDEWTVIINKGYKNGGTDGYKESEDVVRFQVKPEKLKPQMETLTMQFANIKPMSVDFELLWQDFVIRFPITTDFTEKVKKQIAEADAAGKPAHWEAAQFYYEYGKDNAKALASVNKAIEANAARKPFWMMHYKAKIQKDMGDKSGALTSANESINWAKEAKNDNYVTMNEKLIKDLN